MKILKLFKKAGQKITAIIDFKDILMFIGLAMAGKGIYMVYPPAMWFVVGIFLVYLGWPTKAVK